MTVRLSLRSAPSLLLGVGALGPGAFAGLDEGEPQRSPPSATLGVRPAWA